MRIVNTAAIPPKMTNTVCAPKCSFKIGNDSPTAKFVIQFTDKPRDPVAAALAGGTTSGRRTKGIGPSPIEKEDTKRMIAMLARMGELEMVSERRRADNDIEAIEVSRRGRRPTRCRWRPHSYQLLAYHTVGFDLRR